MIETRDLTKTFDNFTAVDSLNLKIEKGEFFGLLGPNGAGKTTTISLLSTLLLPTKGEILIDGQQLTRQRPDLKRKISVITQEYSMRQDMTMDEIMEYQGRLYFMPRKEIKRRTEELLEFCDLLKFRKRTVRKLSGGMKRRVGLVQALLHEPDFLIVDEPTTGLDPEERIRIRNLLVDFAEERTVLFSTHVVEDLMATCNQLAVMKKGRFLYTGTMRELLNKARGHVWECCTEDESLARELERKYHISSKQYTEEGIRLRLLGENMPSESGCIACDVTLEDAYIYVTNR